MGYEYVLIDTDPLVNNQLMTPDSKIVRENEEMPVNIKGKGPTEFPGDEKSYRGKDNFQVFVSEGPDDSVWDNFLEKTPGGHHVQSSSWARLKAQFGYLSVRLMAKQEERIVAGAQLLIRRIPYLGSIAYVPRGPLFSTGDPILVNLFINELLKFGTENNFRYIAIQPPRNGESTALQLLRWGFSPSAIEFAPSATVLIDLLPDLEVILAQMDKEARRNIRNGLRKGITVREGSEYDIPVFYRLLKSTSVRQKFLLYPERYYLEMWRALAPRGNLKLFIAEHDGDVVSTQLAVPFGDTLLNKMSVWSGRYGSLRPNEVLLWTAIAWAKSHGYRYFDFEGIDSDIAKALLSKKIKVDSIKPSVTSFKLKFGGDVMLFPSAYEYVYNPSLRWVYNKLISMFNTSLTRRYMVDYIRSRF